jgi:hypothetical protein
MVVVCPWLSGVTVGGCCLLSWLPSVAVGGGCCLSLIVGCRCRWLLFVPGSRVSLSVVIFLPGCRVSLLVVVVCPWLPGVAVSWLFLPLVVGYRCRWLLLVPGCRVSLLVIVVCPWLSCVAVGGCCLSLVIGCRFWRLLFVPGCWGVAVVGSCLSPFVGCRLSGVVCCLQVSAVAHIFPLLVPISCKYVRNVLSYFFQRMDKSHLSIFSQRARICICEHVGSTRMSK